MMRALLILLLLPSASACVGAQARLHVGPTVDTSGEVGVHGGLTAGFGYATSDRGGLLIGSGVVSGSDTHVGVVSIVEGAHLGEERGELGYRGGFRGEAGLVGDRSFLGASGAVLYPLRQRSSSGGHEKSFQSSTHTLLAVGFEAQAGAVLIDLDEDSSEHETRFGAGAALTLEWLMFSRVH
jgi:hypothetical protein